MDFGVVSGVRRFIVTSKQGDSVYYYALDLKTMFGNTLLYAGVTTALFALAAVVVLFDMFRGYTDKVYTDWAVIRMPGADPQALMESQKEKHQAHKRKTEPKTEEKRETIKKLLEKLDKQRQAGKDTTDVAIEIKDLRDMLKVKPKLLELATNKGQVEIT